MGVNLLGKIKLYDLAKELNLTSKELLKIAGEMGIKVKSHLSSLEDDQIEKIRNRFKNKKNETPKKEKKTNPNKTTTEQHCGDLSKEDVETKELELKDNDYIKNVYLDFEGGVTHLKFVSKNGESIEVGVENDDTKKTIDINLEKTPHMLQTFFGYFNPYGLRALGFKYISKRDFILINLMGIFRLRHIFKINEEEKQKWDNPEELNKLDLKMKAVAKLCLLPDKTFSSVLQFCGM